MGACGDLEAREHFLNCDPEYHFICKSEWLCGCVCVCFFLGGRDSYLVKKSLSKIVVRKASQMVDKASLAQRSASAAIDSGDDFSRLSTQAKDNYDNFDQTIMDLEASQIEDPVYQAPQPANHYGVTTEETCSQCFTPLACN